VGGKSADGASLLKTRKRLACGGVAQLDALFSMSAPAAATYSKDQPFPARMTESRLLNKPGSAKETRHFVVSLAGSGLHYSAGDSVGIFPENRPCEVAEIIRLLGATGDEPENRRNTRGEGDRRAREGEAGRALVAGLQGRAGHVSRRA